MEEGMFKKGEFVEADKTVQKPKEQEQTKDDEEAEDGQDKPTDDRDN